MAIHTGSGAELQMGKESSYSTAVAGTHVINFTSESINVKPDKVDEENLLASVGPMAKDIMRINVDGSVNFVLRPEFAGFIIKAAMGGTDTVTQNSPVTGAHKHSVGLVAANGTLPSYTMIINRKVSTKKYSGVKVDSLTLDAKAGDFVKGSISFKAKDETAGTTASLAALALKSFKTIGATFVMGATTYNINNASFNLSNNLITLDQDYSTGLYSPEPLHSRREATIDFDIPYDTNIDTLKDTNLLTDVLIGSVVLTLVSPSMITGTTPYKVVITMNNVAITDISHNVSGANSIIGAKVSGVALSIGSTAPVVVEIYDATSTAY